MRRVSLFFNETTRCIEQSAHAPAARNRERLDRSPSGESGKRTILAILISTAAAFLHAAPVQGLQPSYGKLPIAFEENRGQAPAGVAYLSRTRNGVVLLRPASIALESAGGKAVAMRFVGAGRRGAPAGEQKLPGITSYLLGDKSDWIRGVPNYASVRYPSIYPGIDAVFHGNQQNLEYDFVLSPGADPAWIRIAFDGADRVRIDAEGNLEVITAQGTIKQRKPKIWQTGPLGRREVAGRYVLSRPAEARFEVDPYDRQAELVIDPVIEYSTYFGSARDDRAQAIATDSTGAAYITGSTATGGVSWGFVSKVNPNGTAVVYTVYFGSNTCDAAGSGIAVDAGKNAVVTGYYTQTDLQGQCNVKQVLGAKINAAGDAFVYELVWGGAQDYGNAVAVDGAGNAYFTGFTNGGFPTTAGVVFAAGGIGGDAFATKLNPSGTPVYSTYLGGGLRDEGLAIAVDTGGNAYIAGTTGSANFPIAANAVQSTIPNQTGTGFITKVNSSATQLLYSTFLGGSSIDSVHGVAVDGQSKIHVAGNTNSSNFPTTANAWDRTCGTDTVCNPYNDGAWHNAEDVFYSKIDPAKAGTAGLLYSTFLGGSKRDFGEAIAIDRNGRLWITGRTASSGDFPTVHSSQGTSGGNYDAFIVQVDPAQSGAASLLFSSFLGGAQYEEGTGINVDPLGNIYATGYTGSANFPVVSPLQPQTAGGNEGFVVKIAAPVVGTPASVSVSPTAITGGSNATGTVTLSAAAPAGGAVVTLVSGNINAATVPASVTVAAGATNANFSITTKSVPAQVGVTITATYNRASKAATLVVNPAMAGIVVNPVSVPGGANSTGTVTLSTAAPAGGALVALLSSNVNAATVPASVSVAAGATTATFAITTKPVATQTPVTITATYGGSSKTITVVVNPPISGIAANPISVTGGAASTGTVTLSTAAPAGGAVVTLASSNVNAAAVPASVTVAASATTATFAITTKPVATQTPVTISASYSGSSKTITVVVNAPIAGIAANPVSVTGGAASTGTVTLSTTAPAGGAVVTLSSSNVNAATVPASVTVAAGATAATFAITTKPVATQTPVTITATYGGASKTATLTVKPPAGLAGVALNPAAVTGGAGSTGTVTLNAAAPAGGTVVTLASSNVNAATVPASVTVAANAATATFAIATKPVTTQAAVTISATYSGTTKTAVLTVKPPVAITALALNPATVMGGAGSTGTVTLNSAAPVGGLTIALTSNNINAATVPASVTVAANTSTANFTIASKTVTTATAVTITGTYGGITKTAALTVNPPAAIAAVTLNPASVTGGAGSTGTVTLNAAAPAGGAIVALVSNNINAATVPATVSVAANATTATFLITSKPVAAQTAVTITATYKGIAKAAVLTVKSPAAPAALAGVSFNPATVIFGSNAIGTVMLTAAAPAGGAAVALASSDWMDFAVPASVTVPPGAISAKFTVATLVMRSTTTITASYNGVNKTATLTSINPSVVGLTCNPNPIIAGNTTICAVSMNGIMPTPTTVWILSDQPFFAPAAGTVTVPAGASTTTFSIATTLVPDQIVAHISANALATATVTTPLTINLTNRGRKWVLNNVQFKGGGTASGYFTYDAATGSYLDVNIQVTPGPDPNNPLGHPPQNLYYYPWPNGFNPTFVDNWSTASVLSVQNPLNTYPDPPMWTLLQLNFAQPLTNAGGTIALVTNPNVAYSSYCKDNTPLLCTPPPANISQELFALPPSWKTASGFYFRVIVSGTVTAQ